ncbi:hypothetical protein [Enterococcus sp. LJL90]
MNIIERYEAGLCSLEELTDRIHGLVDESMEDVLGYDKLAFYVELANGCHDEPFYTGGQDNGNFERNSYKDKSIADVESSANPFLC